MTTLDEAVACMYFLRYQGLSDFEFDAEHNPEDCQEEIANYYRWESDMRSTPDREAIFYQLRDAIKMWYRLRTAQHGA